MVAVFLVLEYLEYGKAGIVDHMLRESHVEHLLIPLLIPVFAVLGWVLHNRSRTIELYSGNLAMAVEERTADLRKRTVELQKTLNRHESYIFSVADRLRNPLQVFLGNIDSMDTSNFTEEQKRAFRDIKEAAKQLEANIAKLTERPGIKEAEKELVITQNRQKI